MVSCPQIPILGINDFLTLVIPKHLIVSLPQAGQNYAKRSVFLTKTKFFFYAACVFVLVLYILCLLLMYVCGCMSIGFILVLHMLCFNFYIACFHCWAENCRFSFFFYFVLFSCIVGLIWHAFLNILLT